MTIVGRSKIDHPSLGTVGGSTLHAQIENIYTNIGNHLAGRYFAYSSIANSTVTTIEHNFGAQFADYKILLYTGSHPNLVRVSNPSASGWTIAATSGFEKTKIDVTAPSTGGPHTFAIFMTQGRGSEVLDDLDDVLIASTPSDNALLVYDAANSRWIPSSAFTEGVLLPNGTTAQRPTGANGIIRYNTDTSSYEGYSSGAWSSLGGGGTVDRVTQASHGFVIGDILYLSGSTYTKAIATAANTAEVVGMVSRVVDSNTFEMTISGEVTGLSGLTAGEAYFLSPTTAGAMTVTEPTTLGQISLPLGVASSTTSFYVTLKRGNTIGGTNARTQISLLVNTTGNIQDVSAYDAGELTGWIYIDATTDLRFFVRAPFAKTGAGTNWNISPSYMGDTPPAGFSLSITSGGVIQYTMPSTAVIPGYSTGIINYALNAPAVGATFPLSIDASTVQSGTITAARLPQVSTSSQGAFPSLITSLDNATATQLGLKQYYHGTNYNSGLAPTVTCSAAGFAVRRAVFIPYQTQDGQWRLRFNIEAAFNSVTVTVISLFVNGVVFKNINSQNEAMACCGFWGGLDSPIPRVYAFNSSTSSNEIAWRSGSAAGAIGVYGSGDVELESKPTWAY